MNKQEKRSYKLSIKCRKIHTHSRSQGKTKQYWNTVFGSSDWQTGRLI